ncbi:MAG: hypothetical protein R3Y54_07740 [Eubacteriales bacterium]
MGSKFQIAMEKLERKYGQYAIDNISLYLIICYGFGYIISLVNPSFLYYLTLNPERIVHGQVWRIFTWIVAPPDTSNLFFVLIMMYFYYSIGTSLERTWGAFRYNVYLLSGMLFTIIGALLFYGCAEMNLLGDYVTVNKAILGTDYYQWVSLYFSTYYINMSIFLAYAATFPYHSVYFMMIIPIQVKWLGIIYGVVLAVEFLQGGAILRFVIGASLLNFGLFFVWGRGKTSVSPAHRRRQKEFKKEVVNSRPVTKHKCAVCGRTERDGEELEFRFCSKCEGNYEYCEDHLYTHKHVTKVVNFSEHQ